jgi:nucleotide-binding universal stress UspA family protein
MTTYSRILVALDLGDHTGRILQHARAIAERFGGSLELLYCVANPMFPDATGLLNPYEPALIEEARGDAQRTLSGLLTDDERTALNVKATALIGDPLRTIVEHAARQNSDLIVMGTHGRTGLTHMFLGSVAERVVREAPCPVLTVR